MPVYGANQLNLAFFQLLVVNINIVNIVVSACTILIRSKEETYFRPLVLPLTC